MRNFNKETFVVGDVVTWRDGVPREHPAFDYMYSQLGEGPFEIENATLIPIDLCRCGISRFSSVHGFFGCDETEYMRDAVGAKQWLKLKGHEHKVTAYWFAKQKN